MRRTIGSLISVAVLVGCGDRATPVAGNEPAGVYAYLARLGPFPVVEGTLTLVLDHDSTITGTWDLHRSPGSDTTVAVGPQLGTGTLAGGRTAGVVWLDLNPGWADNNVVLALVPEASDALRGTWDHATIIGPITGGAVALHRLVR